MADEAGIERLRGRRAPLDLPAAEFRELGHRLVDEIAGFLETTRQRPVTRDAQPSEIRAQLPDDALPEDGSDPAALLDQTRRLMFDRSLHNGHPRFFGYITSSAAPIGMLGDLLAAAVNSNIGGWQLSPVATEIEKQALRWVAELIGFPTSCGGVFVSGGNMANFVCFLAARQARAPWNVRVDGLAGGAGRQLVYATGETHTWIQKAADLFGHGSCCVRSIPMDALLRAQPAALRRMISEDKARGDHPFLVVGTAGTVSTGAVDPLPELTSIAHDEGLWMHVDGAYGALAAALPDADASLRALSDADSVAVDPHKWLYAPLEAGCALVRDPEALPAAFGYRPPYYHFEEETEPKTNFYQYGLQNSRGFRALKVWLSIRQVGRRGFVRMIEDDILLAREMHRLFDEHGEIEAITQGLSVTTFRYVPVDLEAGGAESAGYLNELNEALLTRLKAGGEVFFSNAIIGDVYALRACIVNFRTALEDVEALPEIVARHGRELDRRLRPGAAV